MHYTLLWPAYLTMFLWGPTHPNFLNHSSSITLNTMFIPYGGVDAWCLYQVLLLGTLRILSHSWHNICIQLFGMTQCYILFMILYLVEMTQQWSVDSSFLMLYLSFILYVNPHQSTKSHLLHITMNSIYQWWSIYICFRASLVFVLNYFYVLPKPFMLIHLMHISYFSHGRNQHMHVYKSWASCADLLPVLHVACYKKGITLLLVIQLMYLLSFEHLLFWSLFVAVSYFLL